MSQSRERTHTHINDCKDRIETSFMEDMDIGQPITVSEYHLAIMVVVAAILNPRV